MEFYSASTDRRPKGGVEGACSVSWKAVCLCPPPRITASFLVCSLGFPQGSVIKEYAHSVGELGSIPGLGRSPGVGNCSPLQCYCLENPHGQRSLVDYSPWGLKELDTAKQLSIAQQPELQGTLGLSVYV